MEDTNQDKFWKAVAAVQAEVTSVPRNGVGQIGQRRYTYATLDDILAMLRPLLAKHGLAVSFALSGDAAIAIVAGHGHKEEYPLLFTAPAQTPQVRGSEFTYVRRYFLSGFFGVAPEDDTDAAPAEQAAHAKAQEAAQKPQPVAPQPDGDDEARKRALGRLYSVLTECGIDTRNAQEVRRVVGDSIGTHVTSIRALPTESLLKAAKALSSGHTLDMDPDPFSE